MCQDKMHLHHHHLKRVLRGILLSAERGQPSCCGLHRFCLQGGVRKNPLSYDGEKMNLCSFPVQLLCAAQKVLSYLCLLAGGK